MRTVSIHSEPANVGDVASVHSTRGEIDVVFGREVREEACGVHGEKGEDVLLGSPQEKGKVGSILQEWPEGKVIGMTLTDEVSPLQSPEEGEHQCCDGTTSFTVGGTLSNDEAPFVLVDLVHTVKCADVADIVGGGEGVEGDDGKKSELTSEAWEGNGLYVFLGGDIGEGTVVLLVVKLLNELSIVQLAAREGDVVGELVHGEGDEEGGSSL